MDRVEFVYTPEHGSRLNIAEIELNVLSGQCLKRRIPSLEIMCNEVAAWEKARNSKTRVVDWQFTAEDTRIKLKKLISGHRMILLHNYC